MPLTRYQVRSEFSLADPELYRAADRDDPEALLEGVAMAGLVGVLRQLGDLAEWVSLSLSLSISFGLFVVRIEECCACRFWFWGFWMSVVLNCELLLLICCCFECFWFLIWIFWSDWWSKMEWGFEFYWLSNYGDCYVSVCVEFWEVWLKFESESWWIVILCDSV